MEEGEYKSTYNELARVRCVFEKALTSHKAKCCLATHFCLADREGYSCKDESSSSKCRELMVKLRKKSIFVLKLHDVNGPLPHNMEIRVQAGGLIGINKLLDDESAAQPLVSDINGVLNAAIKKYGSLDNLPYSDVMQSVVQFQGRRKRQH